MTKKQQFRSPPKTSSQIRIIAGQWRGRKLTFQGSDGLRPTPDRVRETLFNWLSTSVPGSRCLDLFAGSGSLAFEALSRGALHVDLVEITPNVVKQLHKQIQLLHVNNCKIWYENALNWINNYDYTKQSNYDIVFIDPPFRTGLAQECIKSLHSQRILSQHAWVYLETGSDESLPQLPHHWKIHREKVAGHVCYRLIMTK